MRYRDDCIPLVSSAHDVYQVYYLLNDLRLAQLNRNDFSSCFLCRKVFPFFVVHPPYCYKLGKKRVVCNRAHQCVCTLEAGDAATRNAAVWRFLAP